ncbi:MAG: GLPGLI family protein [Bacteroidetes bacterium]|nr:GLPGLI family protein [Bacteroidota bacterium]
MFQFSSNTLSINVQLSKLIKTFILAVLILFSTLSYAQKLEGTIHYVKTENIAKKMAVLDYLSKQSIEVFTYSYTHVYGMGNESKNYSILYLNATQTKYEDTEENDRVYGYQKTDYTITRDFSKQTLHDIIEVLGKTYIIEDSLRAPKWIIMNEMKEIAGHICMNAFYDDTLKKQKVVAWYALDIPIGGGPERYFGLPGLMLEVDINDGALVITADRINLKKLTTELNFPKKAKGKKIKEKDYIAILRKQITENINQNHPLFEGLRY